MSLGTAVLVAYTLVLSLLFLYGLNAYLLTLLRWRMRPAPPAPPLPDPVPFVTVQLPVFNERYVLERLVRAAARLDWPRDRLEIQVLDDSDDDTRQIGEQVVARLVAEGVDVRHVTRSRPEGFKAGALREGLAQARGELVAIFDADFVPPPDFLRQAVPHLADPRVACVQGRWEHLNRGYSWLTRAIALGIDGHFAVEQPAKASRGMLLNFNGTAGVWRAAAIRDAGDWSGDTIAEDLDLSYRAQLRGWRIVYLPGLACPAEVPAQMQAFRRQQARWAQGSIQCARKHMGAVWRSRLPLATKAEATLHLTHYAVHPLLLALLLLMPLTIATARIPWQMTAFFFAATFGPWVLYLSSQLFLGTPRPRRRWRALPALTLLGLGLAFSNTLAVARGLATWGGTFHRTPKFRIEQGADTWLDKVYALPIDRTTLGEAALAAVALATAALAWATEHWWLVPWALLFHASYAVLVVVTVRHRAHPARARGAVTDAVAET
jgi:cellulose synthase/poly-beta-1,6-N-acetylglucosamine synthase-like glycosyltransferase